MLELAPTPEQGRQVTRAAVRRALLGAGRRRNLQARVVAVHDALAAPQLAAPAPVVAAYLEVVVALVAMLRRFNEQVAALEQQLAVRFGAHPDAMIVRSQPGLGVVLGVRGVFAPLWSPVPRATSGWWTPATCGHSLP